jgi:uncharacterized membrane protein (Fun14 family)
VNGLKYLLSRRQLTVTDIITSATSSGAMPVAGGGILGFAMGYFCKKLVKFIILGIGLVLALLAYLDYQKLIRVDWVAVQNQTNNFLHTNSQKFMDVVNNIAHEINRHNIYHIDTAYPMLGVAGFLPGFVLGMIKG